jgi:hypothetical protein
VFEQEGSFVIPQTILRYWDPIDETWMQHHLAERRFEVMAVPIYADPELQEVAIPKHDWLGLAAGLLSVLSLVGWLVLRRRFATGQSNRGSGPEPALPPLNPLPQ